MAADDSFERRLAAGLRDLVEAEPLPRPTWSSAPVLTARPGRSALWLLAAAVMVALVGSALLVAGGRFPFGPAIEGPTPIPTASPTASPVPSTSPVPSASTCSGEGSLSFLVSGLYVGPTSVEGVSIDDGSTSTIQFTGSAPQGGKTWFGVDVLVDVASPPFTRDPSDLPVTVEGTSFVKITLRGVEGIDVPLHARDVHIDGTLVTELVETGDFEGVQTWIVGLTRPVCVSVTGELGQPSVVVTLTGR